MKTVLEEIQLDQDKCCNPIAGFENRQVFQKKKNRDIIESKKGRPNMKSANCNRSCQLISVIIP